ncbi:MAG: U32 family peptidase [Christensenellales bacterium]
MKVELLSPAGDFESLKAAVNCGADAVYLGTGDFNARAKAENFDGDELLKAVEYAHLRGVKVYLTVNTLVFNDEFDSLYRSVKKAVDFGVDAFIVQDLGVARFLRESFDGIELHASTQLGIHNLAGAEIAQKAGFKRVVLSRETKLEDIRKIKENTNLEIEFFVQGALCSSFSGNCLISSFKSGDSGNRGRCAQLCRLPYSVGDKSGYLQSTKDLCLINSLQTLSDAGVMSFKIEGRLRRKGYVAIATRAYRKAIDGLCDRNTLKNELARAFSRGFNETAYLYDNYGKLNISINNHQGVKIGKLDAVTPFKQLYRLEISSTHEIAVGDGLKFFDKGKEIASLGVGSVEKKNGKYFIVSAKSATKGSDVYLTLDSKLENDALSTVKEIPLKIECVAMSGRKLFVKATSGRCECEYESDFILEKAKNQALDKKDFIETFQKSEFTLTMLELQTDGVFMAKSVLNECRRKVIDELKKKILNRFKKNVKENTAFVDNTLSAVNVRNGGGNRAKKRIIVVSNREEYLAVKGEEAVFAVSPVSYFEKDVSDLLDDYKIGLCLPIVAEQREIEKIEQLVLKSDFVIANNLWGLKWAGKVRTIAGVGLNVLNNVAIDELKKLNVSDCIMSLEMHENGFNCSDEYFYSLGNPTLMNFVYCPFKELYGKGETDCNKCRYKKIAYKDAKENGYALRRIKCDKCRFELLGNLINSVNKHAMNEYIDLRGLTAKDLQFALEGKQISPDENTGKLKRKIK